MGAAEQFSKGFRMGDLYEFAQLYKSPLNEEEKYQMANKRFIIVVYALAKLKNLIQIARINDETNQEVQACLNIIKHVRFEGKKNLCALRLYKTLTTLMKSGMDSFYNTSTSPSYALRGNLRKRAYRTEMPPNEMLAQVLWELKNATDDATFSGTSHFGTLNIKYSNILKMLRQ